MTAAGLRGITKPTTLVAYTSRHTHRLSGRHKYTHMHILRNAGPHFTVSVGPPTSPLGKPGAFFDELLFVSLALIVQHLAVRPLDAHHPLVCPPALVVLQIAV